MNKLLLCAILTLAACTSKVETKATPADLKVHYVLVDPAGGGEILFQDGQFSCKAGEHRLILLAPPQKIAVEGCYSIDKDTVHFKSEAGDGGDVPLAVLHDITKLDAPNS